MTSPLIDLEKEYLEVYSDRCLRCSHLVDSAAKTFNRCHYSRGNTHCPAKEVGIVVFGKIQRYLDLIREARKSKDSMKESELWASLSKESPQFRHRFYERFDDPIKED